MRRVMAVLLLLATTLLADTPPKTIFGFKDASKELALESQFDAKLTPDNPRAWMKRLTSHPHHVGSPWGKENAEFIAAQFRSWGYDTAIERFDVLFPTPKTRVLELLGANPFRAKLQEQPLAEDATSSQTAEILPTYNAYSIDGDVTGQLVYVNYGLPKDYEVLERNGVDVKGKIVIARYGASWRGIKPKVAAEHGAIGCIIYSDPHDDGWYWGDEYPKGAYRNESSAQRGSVADMPVRAGDPATPNAGATPNTKRLAKNEIETLTKIPVLPISYGDAQPLLRALGGPMAPEKWRGALPMPYRLGPSSAPVHLKLEFNWDTVPAYDVIARLKGTDLADQWIIRGNHHDGWVHGANDPVSGLVAMMEEARGIAELTRTGWRPRRTLIFCAWDGEEPGLLGSTEWVEAHLPELREHAAIYINTDSTERGYFYAGGSQTLERFVTEVARDVVDPERKVSLQDRRRAVDLMDEELGPDERKKIREQAVMPLEPLGSGSDFTPFLQHAGIASLNAGLGGEDEYGVYHSMYDSFDHFSRFVDPTFEYEVVAAKTMGRLMLRLGNADFLPFEAKTLTDTIGRYVDEVQKLEEKMRAETEDLNRSLRDRAFELAADPTRPFVNPKPKDEVPHLEFAPLRNALERLNKSAAEFDKASARDDRAVMHLEQALTRSEGLPGRPWFVHHVYAPGLYTGYGVKTLPGVREAIEQRNWKQANEQIVILAGVLNRYADALDAAHRGSM